ncbi:hypothetical protein BC830DRAFT_1176052, partial [Chytriomyces sp. MP71]
MKSGALQAVPPTIPPHLYSTIAAAAQSAQSQQNGLPPANVQGFGSGGAGATAPVSPLRAGSIGGSVAPPPSFDKRRSMTVRGPPSVTTSADGVEWAIQADEKALSDTHFENLDVAKKGLVSGSDSYQFFLKSQLDQAVLAHIWDLANINKSEGLTKDEFSVAMHLIKLAMTGIKLPDTLPANLVPPSLRTRSSAGIATMSAAPIVAPMLPTPVPALAAPAKSTSLDLMGLEASFQANP